MNKLTTKLSYSNMNPLNLTSKQSSNNLATTTTQNSDRKPTYFYYTPLKPNANILSPSTSPVPSNAGSREILHREQVDTVFSEQSVHNCSMEERESTEMFRSITPY